MRDLLILTIHLFVTCMKLLRPGGVRAVAAESLLLKHQIWISNRSRHRAPNLTTLDRFGLGLTTLFIRSHRKQCVIDGATRRLLPRSSISIPGQVRVILVPARGAGEEDILAREKLCPVVAMLPYSTFKEAIAQAKANLLVEGAGHTAAVYSYDENHIRDAGVGLPISRLVVNQSSSLSAGRSLTNGFAPSTTLGCGSWGRNSISENLDFKHQMNVSRIGKVIEHRTPPTDDEIFAA